MILHTNKKLFHDAVLATSDFLNMREIYIEKDYWVTLALYTIFHSDYADQAVFKGGTSLSKCYKLIDRFSEDIDIVILRNEGENDNQLKKKLRIISKIVEQQLPEIKIDGLTNKRGNIRKTVHQYNKLFNGIFGQVREQVVLEATWLGNFEPFSKMKIGSYIYEMMKAKGQQVFINQYNMAPFTINVLSKFRTFCEKIMSLVRFSKMEEPIAALRNKIRHIYDLHQMQKDKKIQQFLNSNEFDKMLIIVGHDDIIGYKNNNEWLLDHPSTALIFEQSEKTWRQLSNEYNSNFKDLVIGSFPPEEELIKTLKYISDRLKKVKWNLK